MEIAAENIATAANRHYILAAVKIGYESIEEQAKSDGLTEALRIIKVALEEGK